MSGTALRVRITTSASDFLSVFQVTWRSKQPEKTAQLKGKCERTFHFEIWFQPCTRYTTIFATTTWTIARANSARNRSSRLDESWDTKTERKKEKDGLVSRYVSNCKGKRKRSASHMSSVVVPLRRREHDYVILEFSKVSSNRFLVAREDPRPVRLAGNTRAQGDVHCVPFTGSGVLIVHRSASAANRKAGSSAIQPCFALLRVDDRRAPLDRRWRRARTDLLAYFT